MRAIDFGPTTWRTSSYSSDQANCVQVGWRTSSYSSDTSNCVEVRPGTLVGVRDSKNPDGGLLAFPAAAWTTACREHFTRDDA